MEDLQIGVECLPFPVNMTQRSSHTDMLLFVQGLMCGTRSGDGSVDAQDVRMLLASSSNLAYWCVEHSKSLRQEGFAFKGGIVATLRK
jgi:hypothetical protein